MIESCMARALRPPPTGRHRKRPHPVEVRQCRTTRHGIDTARTGTISVLMTAIHHRDFTLDPIDNERLANLAGPFDEHLRQIELALGVQIANRGTVFRVSGPADTAEEAEKLLHALYAEAGETVFDSHAIHLRLNRANVAQVAERAYEAQDVAIKVKRGTVRGRGATTITQLHLRKPKAGALRGINLAELLMLRAESVMVLLPRITEPPLLKHEVESMEPVDLIACATEVVNFLAPQATLEKAQEAQREAAYLTE